MSASPHGEQDVHWHLGHRLAQQYSKAFQLEREAYDSAGMIMLEIRSDLRTVTAVIERNFRVSGPGEVYDAKETKDDAPLADEAPLVAEGNMLGWCLCHGEHHYAAHIDQGSHYFTVMSVHPTEDMPWYRMAAWHDAKQAEIDMEPASAELLDVVCAFYEL